MYKPLICIIALFALLSCTDQNRAIHAERSQSLNETEKNIYRCGDSMLAAFNRKDWTTFVKYNHPNMTRMMGGVASFASFISKQMDNIPDTVIKSVEMGKILQMVTTPKDLQCVVEQIIKMNLDGKIADKKTYLIGESLDKGNNWTFFDASTKTGLTPQDIKPDISQALKVPR
jgi:hypothetical protein